MSLATIKIELSSRSGRHLLPSFFPVDLLIAMIREFAIAVDRGMTKDELTEFVDVLRPYVRKLIGMHDEKWLVYYDANTSDLFSSLCDKLYEHLRDELVSKLIEYSLPRLSLADHFAQLLDLKDTEQSS